MNSAKAMIACVSDEYTKSENCKLEFRFAHVSLRMPIVKAVVGQGNDWRNHEIAFLGGAYPEVNFQFENPNAHHDLLELVKSTLEKAKESERAARQAEQQQQQQAKSSDSDETNTAYQELFELTQRKFLKQLAQFCEKMDSTSRPYPRLFCIDFIEASKLKVNAFIIEKKILSIVINLLQNP